MSAREEVLFLWDEGEGRAPGPMLHQFGLISIVSSLWVKNKGQ